MENTMKKTTLLILAAIMAVLSNPVGAMNIRNFHSGSWFDEDRPGHGLSLEVVDADTMVIYWFVHHPDGTPMWLVSEADIEGDTAVGDAYYVSGMPFGTFSPASRTEQAWGTLSITLQDCNAARLSYSSPMSHGGIPFGSGEIDLVRLTSIHGLECSLLPHGKFGNFSSGLESGPDGGWPVNSFVWILRDGTLAFQAAGVGDEPEIGFGQLTMTGQDTFDFEVRSSNGVQQGAGVFEDDRVTLDLGTYGLLSEPLDPAFSDAVTYEDLAGTYMGPDAMWIYSVDLMGEINGNTIGGEISGNLAIAEPGFNQLVVKTDSKWVSNRGVGVFDRTSGNLYFIGFRKDSAFVFDWLWFAAPSWWP